MERCPTCGSATNHSYPVTDGDDAVYNICHDTFHDKLPPVRDETDRRGNGPVINRQDF